MEILVVSLVAIVVAGLTLFSGFGLGSLLMPVFAIFFPVQIAIAATAVVHLANNIFKIFLVGRKADLKIVILFALPAALSAALGAFLLSLATNMEAIYTYDLAGRVCEITLVKIAISMLIIFFSLFDLLPVLKKFSFSKKYVPVGGILSGFLEEFPVIRVLFGVLS